MLTLDFINVGYGDAILIREGAFSMLVDCGDVDVGRSSPQGCRVMAGDYLRAQGVRHLDVLVLTHLHLDHSGGLTRLLDTGVTVGEMWTNYLPPEAHWGKSVPVAEPFSPGAKCLLTSLNVYLRALPRLRDQGARIERMTRSGLTRPLTWALTAGVYLEDPPLHVRQEAIWAHVLEGRAAQAELTELDAFINNTSIRLRLTYGAQSVELPGDVYARCWEKHALSPCTLVKLPHHGHADAVTPRLLDMLRPAHAVISVSDDRTDDCPSGRVLRALEEAGASVCCTDAVPLPGGRDFHEAARYLLTPDGQARRSFLAPSRALP